MEIGKKLKYGVIKSYAKITFNYSISCKCTGIIIILKSKPAFPELKKKNPEKGEKSDRGIIILEFDHEKLIVCILEHNMHCKITPDDIKTRISETQKENR